MKVRALGTATCLQYRACLVNEPALVGASRHAAGVMRTRVIQHSVCLPPAGAQLMAKRSLIERVRWKVKVERSPVCPEETHCALIDFECRDDVDSIKYLPGAEEVNPFTGNKIKPNVSSNEMLIDTTLYYLIGNRSQPQVLQEHTAKRRSLVLQHVLMNCCYVGRHAKNTTTGVTTSSSWFLLRLVEGFVSAGSSWRPAKTNCCPTHPALFLWPIMF